MRDPFSPGKKSSWQLKVTGSKQPGCSLRIFRITVAIPLSSGVWADTKRQEGRLWPHSIQVQDKMCHRNPVRIPLDPDYF